MQDLADYGCIKYVSFEFCEINTSLKIIHSVSTKLQENE